MTPNITAALIGAGTGLLATILLWAAFLLGVYVGGREQRPWSRR